MAKTKFVCPRKMKRGRYVYHRAREMRDLEVGDKILRFTMLKDPNYFTRGTIKDSPPNVRFFRTTKGVLGEISQTELDYCLVYRRKL